MKVSLKTISEITGFSQATISNALHNKRGVNPKTAEQILKVAQEYGYIQEKRITNIKVVTYRDSGGVFSDTPFFSILMESVENEAHKCGYTTSIYNLYRHSEDYQERLQSLLEDTNSAILLIGTELQEEDAANAEKIYEAMKGLTLSQASDERIWAAYALGPFKDYIIKRWNPQSSSSMMDHCFFMQSPHRSLYRQGISRLWWIARVTRDSAPGEDPYRLTKFVFTHTDIVPSICEQPVCQNLEIMHGVIQTLYDFEQKYQEEERENIPVNQRKGIRINKAVIQDVGKYLNFRAGTYLLDLFTKEKICAIVQKRLMKKWGPSKKSAV